MRPNPLDDAGHFLTQPGWFTPVFWLLLLASIAIAVLVWRTDPAQRTLAFASRLWVLRCWSAPCGGSRRFGRSRRISTACAIGWSKRWRTPACRCRARLVGDLVLPNLNLFGPLVYLIEVAIGVSLLLGLFSRLGALLGVLMGLNLWLGLYSAPGEWPWTYMFLIIIQTLYAIDPPGRVLGADALLRRRVGDGTWNRVLSWVV